LQQQDARRIEPAELVLAGIDALRAVAVREEKPVAKQFQFLHAAKIVGQRQQEQVELAVEQLLVDAVRAVFRQVQAELRMGLAQLRQHARQQERRDRRDDAEPQAAAKRVAALT